MARRVVVLGAGIVGSAVAERLSGRADCAVTVVDRVAGGRLPGSTGHAPGFVGTLGDDPVLTALARDSVAAYRAVEGGFDTVGGLELAGSAAAVGRLAGRLRAAHAAGLDAAMVEPDEAVRLAPRLVDPARVTAALHFPRDGTARADVITAALRARATAAGARFVLGHRATGIDVRAGRVTAVRAGDDVLPADDVVLASGIWGPAVARMAGVELPLVPVAHPYVHSAPRAPARAPSPFVRWPEHHVYARDHGDRDGLGTYDHEPVPVAAPGDHAELPWPGSLFDDAITAAVALLPDGHRWRPAARLNGLFSMTADNLPLLGACRDVAGLWSAVAVWVTHAAGAAAALAAEMLGDSPGTAALAPDRFAGVDPGELHRGALTHYRDIYATS